jgi:hypothetical protein
MAHEPATYTLRNKVQKPARRFSNESKAESCSSAVMAAAIASRATLAATPIVSILVHICVRLTAIGMHGMFQKKRTSKDQLQYKIQWGNTTGLGSAYSSWACKTGLSVCTGQVQARAGSARGKEDKVQAMSYRAASSPEMYVMWSLFW